MDFMTKFLDNLCTCLTHSLNVMVHWNKMEHYNCIFARLQIICVVLPLQLPRDSRAWNKKFSLQLIATSRRGVGSGEGAVPPPQMLKIFEFCIPYLSVLERQKDNLNRFCITILSSFPQGIIQHWMTYYKRTINIDWTILVIRENRKAFQQNWQMKWFYSLVLNRSRKCVVP